MPKIGKYAKWLLTEEDKIFLKDNFLTMTNRELATHFNLSMTVFRQLAYAEGHKRMELEYWTEEQVQFLYANYKMIGDIELAEMFNDNWHKGKGWTRNHIEKKRRYLFLKRTDKELKKIRRRNVMSGRYALANKNRYKTNPPNPIGAIVMWRRYPHIKTEDGYVNYNRWLWEQSYGKVPKRFVVTTKEGAPEIPTLEFLELISRGDNAIRNKTNYHLLPKDLQEIISLKNKLTKKIKSS